MKKNLSVEIPIEGLAGNLIKAMESIPSAATMSISKKTVGYYEDSYSYSIVFSWTETL